MHTEADRAVERRGLEPRSLLCKSSVRPLNYHPRAGHPSGQPARIRHDVKESNPLDGSFGGSPAFRGLRRMSPPPRRRLRHSVSLRRSSQPFGSLFFSFFLSFSLVAAGGIRTRDLLVPLTVSPRPGAGKRGERRYSRRSDRAELQGEGWSRRESNPRQSDGICNLLLPARGGRRG
jgi:hypothetical protein